MEHASQTHVEIGNMVVQSQVVFISLCLPSPQLNLLYSFLHLRLSLRSDYRRISKVLFSSRCDALLYKVLIADLIDVREVKMQNSALVRICLR